MTQKIWKFFCSLKLTVILFSLLALSTLVGSFIIQRPVSQTGQIERAYSPETLALFEALGFFDLFHSAWFVFFLLLIGVNVTCCSIDMWPRHVRKAFTRDPKLSDQTIRNLPHFAEITPVAASGATLRVRIAATLKKYFKAPEVMDEGGIYRFHVNKARLAHFGVYVIHTGIIIVLCGGVWGSLDGFEGQMALKEGETSNVVRLKTVHRQRELGFSVRCREVKKTDYDSGSPKEFISDLEVLDADGNVLKRKTIEVNDPLEHDGIKFYQADYKTLKTNVKRFFAFKITDRNSGKATSVEIPEEQQDEAVKLPGSQKMINVFYHNSEEHIPTSTGVLFAGEVVKLLYGTESVHETIALFKDYPQLDMKTRPDAKETFEFLGLRETYKLAEVTGLQVARDPGAKVVFTGAAFMVTGILWAFLTSHQKIWVNATPQVVLIGGRGHRHPWAFKARFERLVADLQQELELG